MILPSEIFRDIVAHAEKDAPLEACGYLAGGAGAISRSYPMTNIDQSEDHFSFDPKEQFEILKAVRRDGLDLIGVYHSHPRSPANPSQEDVRLAADPSLLYVIVSLLDGERTLNGFHIRQGVIEQVPLAIPDLEPASEEVLDLAALKKTGMIQQKQKDYFALRLHAVAGDLTAAQMRAIVGVAEKFGRGRVHISTRQGIEIHFVHHANLETARKELASAGVTMGACGPRVRIVTGCPGSQTCRWGIIDTKEIAAHLDRTYFREDTPHKFKMAVTGCPHNCAKATENDIGVMGGILPGWSETACTGCGLCVNICPTAAIIREGDRYALDLSRCINCSICTSTCPSGAWTVVSRGYLLWIGGTMGKRPRFAGRLGGLIDSKERLYELIERSITYYREHGRKKERFGHMIDRIGEEQVSEEILHE